MLFSELVEGGVQSWKFRTNDFEIVVGLEGPLSGSTLRVCTAHGGHAHFSAKSSVKIQK